jgi:glycosidase
MPWSASGEEWSDPWLPLVDTSRNVETQDGDPKSTLELVRTLIAWRRELGDAPYETLPSPRNVWAYSRGAATCVVNLSGRRATYDGRRLEPWETVID